MTPFLVLQGLIGMVAMAAWALDRLRAPFVQQQHILRAGLVAIPVVLIAAQLFHPTGDWTPPTQRATVWASGVATPIITAPLAPYVAEAARQALPWWLIPAGACLLWAAVDMVRLGLAVGRTTPLRTHRAVQVRRAASGTPYALWLPFRRIVVLDEQTLDSDADRVLALRHELQHHRSADPVWAWGWTALSIAGALNPAAWWLARHVQRVDELACDAAIVRHSSPVQYADTLVRAARRRTGPLPQAALAAHRTLVQRRVHMLLNPTPRRRIVALPTMGLVIGLLAATAWAGTPTPSADLGPSDVVVDADVVRQTAASMPSSAWIQHGLTETSRVAAVKAELIARGMPQDLAAVPLVESGYQNLTPAANPVVNTAGLWQFIPQTAATYGLTINGNVDERRDMDKSTDAALRLLADLHGQFDDWGLALAAYNMGPQAVRRAIEAEGTTDIIALVEARALPSYPVDVMAGAAILRAEGLID